MHPCAFIGPDQGVCGILTSLVVKLDDLDAVWCPEHAALALTGSSHKWVSLVKNAGVRLQELIEWLVRFQTAAGRSAPDTPIVVELARRSMQYDTSGPLAE